MQQFTKHFNEITESDLPETGAKAATLGILYQKNNIPYIAEGFVVTAAAYRYFINYNRSTEKLQTILQNLNADNTDSLDETALKCQKIITNGKMPQQLETAITQAYHSYFSESQEVAVRGSVTAYMPNTADTYLNISGTIALSFAVKCCFASLFTEESLRYLLNNNLSVSDIGMGVIIQKMVRSDIGASGTVAVSGNTITLKSIFGLGELLPTDEAEPDIFIFDYNTENNTLLSKRQGKKSRMYVYADHAAGTNSTLLKITPAGLREHFSLTDDEALNLIEWTQHGYTDFEWAKDGISNRFYLINTYGLS
ncbi:MAG: PEP/pyruvate-binding domain-containing protein [Bacteroidia bacterium]